MGAVLLSWFAKVTGFPPLNRFLGGFNPPRHHWNRVILIDVAMSLLLVMVEMVAEGTSPNPIRVLVVTVCVGLEGAGVALGIPAIWEIPGISTG
jgi:hypothetical protein